MSEKLQESLLEMIADQLNLKTENIKLSHHIINDLKADSLDVVELVMSAEEKWNLSIPDEDAEKMETAQDLLDYIKKNYKEES